MQLKLKVILSIELVKICKGIIAFSFQSDYTDPIFTFITRLTKGIWMNRFFFYIFELSIFCARFLLAVLIKHMLLLYPSEEYK